MKMFLPKSPIDLKDISISVVDMESGNLYVSVGEDIIIY